MPILNGLSKKLSEVAQTTVQVSKELAGSAKATLAISAEEREIEKAYRALGQWYYSTKGENPEEAAEFIETVDTSLRKIREIRQEAEAAKTAATAEHIEYITEIEAAKTVESTGAASEAGIWIHSGMAEPIVFALFIRIRQNRIGFVHFFELLFCLFVVGIPVRMILHGHLTECLLDFIIRCALLKSKHFVIISFFSHLSFLSKIYLFHLSLS